MDEFDDLNLYNGDSVHDMYVDSDYAINTHELPYELSASDDDIVPDDYSDFIDDWD